MDTHFPHRAATLFAVALLTITAPASAQRWIDTTRPLQPSFGYRLDEFPIIASPTKWSGTVENHVGDFRDLWSYASSMGFSVYHMSLAPPIADYLDQMMSADDAIARWGAGHDPQLDTGRVILSWGRGNWSVWSAGLGRAIEFYTFDSVQSPYFHWWFGTRSGGVKRTNAFDSVSEVWYSAANTTPGALVSSDLSYVNPTDSNDVKHFFDHTVEARDERSGAGRTYTFVLTGHLLDSMNVANGPATPVFRVVIWHRLGGGESYLNDTLGLSLAPADTAILVDTFSVTKVQLGSEDSMHLRHQFRSVEHGADLRWRPIDAGPGPMNTGQPGLRRVDVRIFWTGAEEAALRSLALRDSMGQLMLGQHDDSSQLFRERLADTVALFLRGSTDWHNLDSLRHAIVAVESGTEPALTPLEFAGFEAVNMLLRSGTWRPAGLRR